MNFRPVLAFLMLAALAGCSGLGGTPGGDTTVASLTLSPLVVTILPGQTANVTVVAKNKLGAVLNDAQIAWRSDNSGVATVNAGVVTGVAAGVAFVTASSGDVTSDALKATVNAPSGANGLTVQANQALAADGVTTWVGGRDIVLRVAPVNGVTPMSVDFTISGAGPLVASNRVSINGAHTATTTFTIPYTLSISTPPASSTEGYENRVTQSGVLVTVTAIHKLGGGVEVPTGSKATIGLNVDNQSPTASWTGTRIGAFESGCSTFPYTVANGAVAPGTSLTWNYSVSDAGVGLTSTRILNLWQRVNRVTDGGKGFVNGVLYSDYADNLDRNGNNGVDFTAPKPNYAGSFDFRTLAHGKHYVLYPTDALGNHSLAVDYSNDANRGKIFDRICNAYWEKSDFPTTDKKHPATDGSNLNPNYKPELSHHNIPEIDAITFNASATDNYSVTLSGLRASPPAAAPTDLNSTYLCYYCVGSGTQASTGGMAPASLTEVRFYRRLLTADKLAPFEYVGSNKGPFTGDSVTFASNAVSKTSGGQYAVAAAAFNDHSAVGFVASDETPFDPTQADGGPNGYGPLKP